MGKKSRNKSRASKQEPAQNATTACGDDKPNAATSPPPQPEENKAMEHHATPLHSKNLKRCGCAASEYQSDQDVKRFHDKMHSASSGERGTEQATVQPEVMAHNFAAGDTPESLAKEILEGLKTTSGTAFPRRPLKAAQAGKPVPLVVNCYRMTIPNSIIYHYDVTVFPKDLDEQKKAPDVKDKYRVLRNKLNQTVMQKAFETFDIFHNLLPVYDGQRNIYVKKRLEFDSKTYTGAVSITENDRVKEFEVEIKFAREVDLYRFHAVYENHASDIPQDVLTVIDIILRYGLSLHLTPVSRSFYSPPDERNRDKQYVGEGKELWFGAYQSFRPSEKGAVLNVDKTATTFFTPMSVVEFIMEYLKCDENQLRRGLTEEQSRRLTSELSTLSVRTKHMENVRDYRVLRVARERPRDVKFTMDRDGTTVELNVEEYFRKQYGITLCYPNLPCLQAQPEQKRLFLPIELCYITEGQHYKKKFSGPEVINLTATPPVERFRDIARRLEAHMRFDQLWLKEFNITIERKPLNVMGRVLEPPKMKFGEVVPGKENAVEPAMGSWDMRNQPFLVPARFGKWAVLSLSRRPLDQEIEKFKSMFEREAKKCGMVLASNPVVLQRDRRMSVDENVQQGLRYLKAQSAELVIIILESKNSDYYQVKTIAETHIGIKTQCVLEKNVKRTSASLIANILLKVNKKMGGTSSAIPRSEKPKCLHTPTMVVSADVCHSSPGEKRTPSVAAAVGSMDVHLMTYHSVVKVQERSGEFSTRVIEIITKFEEMMVELLQEFKQRNNSRIPDRIIVYRDGVSEGQFLQVRNHEIQALHKACFTVGGESYKPLITFVIVDKRHHIRFMPEFNKDGAGKDGNVPPGTVIDTVVTHPTIHDFFLCSHLGLRGTSRPTRYCVLWDDSEFSADEIQKLTLFFCYNSASCNKATSTPAAARYADQAAGRARQHLLGNDSIEEVEISDLSAAQQAILVCEEVQRSMYFL